MKGRVATVLLLAFGTLPSSATAQALEFETERFAFEVDGDRLVGLLDAPHDPRATVIIVHGYGETRVVEQNWFYDLRARFAGLGLNVLVWDKPGCGESEGVFDINQPVESSADEVVAAMRALQARGMLGTGVIGLWGISRAGWIAPLAMQAAPEIAFWISVSGTDDKENGRYLLASNFPIEGRPQRETDALVAEWQRGFDAVWQGGDYQDYLDARPTLSQDPFAEFMGWGGHVSEEAFYAYQARFESGEFVVDEEAGLQVYVPDFRQVLGAIDRPVLALFGEKDTNVDWRATSRLYRATIGANPRADLAIKTFPDANHNLKQAQTGGVREMYEQPWDTPYAEGYFEAMADWLVAKGFGQR